MLDLIINLSLQTAKFIHVICIIQVNPNKVACRFLQEFISRSFLLIQNYSQAFEVMILIEQGKKLA